MHIGFCIVHASLICEFTCRNIIVNKELSTRTKIVIMDTKYLDTKFGLMESITQCKYLGVIISDHNCDLDLKRQMRKFYTNANMLIRKFFKCTVDVKCYLFKTYCSTLYCSAMWFDSTKSAMKKLKVAYNNSLRRLLSLPTYNSASEMFAVLNIPSFGELLRKFAFSLMTRIASSINSFMVNIYSSSVPMFSKIWGWWYSILTI